MEGFRADNNCLAFLEPKGAVLHFELAAALQNQMQFEGDVIVTSHIPNVPVMLGKAFPGHVGNDFIYGFDPVILFHKYLPE